MITIISSVTLHLTTNNAYYLVRKGGNCDPRLKPTYRYYLQVRHDENEKWKWVECWETIKTDSFDVSEIREHICKYEERAYPYTEGIRR